MKYDPTNTKALDKKLEDRKEEGKREREREAEEVVWLMSNKIGRRLVWRMLQQAGVFQPSFSTNALQMAFAEGNRNYGNRLLSIVNSVCPNLYLTMVEEANEQTKPSGG